MASQTGFWAGFAVGRRQPTSPRQQRTWRIRAAPRRSVGGWRGSAAGGGRSGRPGFAQICTQNHTVFKHQAIVPKLATVARFVAKYDFVSLPSTIPSISLLPRKPTLPQIVPKLSSTWSQMVPGLAPIVIQSMVSLHDISHLPFPELNPTQSVQRGNAQEGMDSIVFMGFMVPCII